MLEFEALLRSYADRVEGYLHSCFTDADEPQQVLFDAMRYSLLAGESAFALCWRRPSASCAAAAPWTPCRLLPP